MTDKAILVIDMPSECNDEKCPLCYDFAMCSYLNRWIEDGKPNDCPLKHPLKEVSNDFYIYDTEYLFKNLDREIDLLKSTERFKEYMRNREE